jgi:F0F1-type ATP synthase epsilon subunit
MLLDVSMCSPREVIYEGKATSVIVPGEAGVFEVLPFHKRIVSRLISGTLYINDQGFPIRRGVVKVNQNRVMIIVEQYEP